MIGRVFGYVVKKSFPYAIAFTIGAVVGSGVLSKDNPENHVQQQVNVYDEQGRGYVVDLETKMIKETTDAYQKKEDNKLVELLK